MNADDLLRRALEELERADDDLCQEFYTGGEWESPPIIEEIRAYLDAPKDKPVAYRLRPPPRFEGDEGMWYFNDDPECEVEMREKGWSVEPLFTHPSKQMKPIIYDEVEEALQIYKYRDMPEFVNGFMDGVSWAEQHHEIGGSDE